MTHPSDIDELDLVPTLPAEQLLLGRITGWDLPRPYFDVWLLGRLDRQREVENLQAEVRRLDALDAQPAPVDVRGLLGPTFAELCRRRGEPALAERADASTRARLRGAA
ncbi:MAG: hypothetical protein M3N46_02620 [Actinomycetota bacterium]|nr:hypothetical protein [Actinomycetota bacterium]